MPYFTSDLILDVHHHHSFNVFIFLFALIIASSTRMLDQDIHTLFKEGSFDKFTDDMVRQFMKEEALQAQHQVKWHCHCLSC